MSSKDPALDSSLDASLTGGGFYFGALSGSFLPFLAYIANACFSYLAFNRSNLILSSHSLIWFYIFYSLAISKYYKPFFLLNLDTNFIKSASGMLYRDSGLRDATIGVASADDRWESFNIFDDDLDDSSFYFDKFFLSELLVFFYVKTITLLDWTSVSAGLLIVMFNDALFYSILY